MSDKELVDKIVMFRTELERQKAGMGIMSLFDIICSYYGEQHRTIESQKEEIEFLKKRLQGEKECAEKNHVQYDAMFHQLAIQKAITELAVKRLKEISNHHPGIADNTLSEIERLSQ